MDKSKVDFFIAVNGDKFPAISLPSIKERMLSMSDDQIMIMQASYFQNPTAMLLIAIFLGWERFFLEDIGLGVLKVLTCYGLGLWWLIDIFTAMDRTRSYNYDKFMRVTGY